VGFLAWFCAELAARPQQKGEESMVLSGKPNIPLLKKELERFASVVKQQGLLHFQLCCALASQLRVQRRLSRKSGARSTSKLIRWR
jgi:hypothetical protein